MSPQKPSTGKNSGERLDVVFFGRGSILRDEVAVLLLGGTVLLALDNYYAQERFLRRAAFQLFGLNLSPPAPRMAELCAGFILFFLLPLLLSFATRGSFHERYGLGLGDVRFGLMGATAALAVILPLVFAASHLRMFYSEYPLAGRAAFQSHGPSGLLQTDLGRFAWYELCYVLYFCAWEFFYRGWLLQGLSFRLGPRVALLVTTMPFALSHWEKPAPEAFGAILAGLFLGKLALRSRSMWYGALVHACAAVAMDVLAARMRLAG